MLAGLCAVVFMLVGWTSATTPVRGPHSAVELFFLRDQIQGLPVQFGTYFVTAGRCAGCHGFDSLGLASVDSNGVSVNVVDDWRSTMMANSARDPFFLAKMEHEGLVNPALQSQLEHNCLKCHAPLAVFEQQMLGNPPFTAAHLDTSVMAMDGVSCLACHMQKPDAAGHYFSGDLHFDSARVWGPYTQEQINEAIMEFFVGFTPDQGSHILDGRVCAGCHTAINQPVDLNGNPTGTSFFEQTVWQEYVNSVYYGTEENCRSCHLPRIEDSITLASEYVFLEGQSPFGKHHLTGGGTFMLKMMKAHIGPLGIPATPVQFDSTIARSERHLRSSVEMSLLMTDRTADTLYMDVALTNIIGHKFPSGFPNRRAFVQVVAVTATDDTLFHSGGWGADYEVLGHDSVLEPHYDVIDRPDQAQIYEMVMGDVNGDVTTTLLRAVTPLKDNRLVPIGFSTSHPSYDTTVIAGDALTDPDFNHDALGLEGNGGDIIHYHIPTNGYDGPLQVKARVWFQQVPPRWNREMFNHSGARIDAFRSMYDAADNTPDLVAADSMSVLGMGMAEQGGALGIFPNPTRDGLVRFTLAGPGTLRAYDATGREVPVRTGRQGDAWWCRLPDEPGTYHLVVDAGGRVRVARVLRLR